MVVGNDEGGALEKGVGEDQGTHAGGSAVLVGGFGQVGDTDASRLYGEGEEGAEVRRMVVGVAPLRRAGRKAVKMAVSIGAK